MRILFIQPGDFFTVYYNLKKGLDETYYGQKFCVDYISNLAHHAEAVGVLSHTNETYEESISDNFSTLGINLMRAHPSVILPVLDDFEPTHIVLRMPVIYIIDWAIAHNVRLLPLFAESFTAANAAHEQFLRGFADILNHPKIERVANHSTPAAESLINIGVEKGKVVAYEFDPQESYTPERYPDKVLNGKRNFSGVYVGAALTEKGVEECIEATALLNQSGTEFRLTIAGEGNRDHFESLCVHKRVTEKVFFTGVVPNRSVISLMQDNDLVLVPSRHLYPEASPLTIYEALCSKTPLVLSDHPMFLRRFTSGETAMIFESGNAADLTRKIQGLLADGELYAAISSRSLATWRSLQSGTTWSQVINTFIEQ